MASWAGDGDVGQAVRRVTSVFEEAVSADDGWDRVNFGSRLWSVRDNDLAQFGFISIGAGVVRHGHSFTVGDVAGQCGAGDQTIAWWGLSEATLRELATVAGARGVDRVVPVGKALDFSIVWDGINLLDDFSRKVSLIF
jgi:hypothetical protein